ncbi:MAG TPA: hypothetical protein VN495_03280 [Candidatus Paceibacterota bacterium]|nr:hypothetical protein [Candidatus Paceibacterota bacterium]
MRTRWNPLRRNHQLAPREYAPSVSIRISADSLLVLDTPKEKLNALTRINEEFPWVDEVEGKNKKCTFELDRRGDRLFSSSDMHPISQGQQRAFEKYAQKLGEELRKIKNKPGLWVNDIYVIVTYMKVVTAR